jgi:hypothetical protein
MREIQEETREKLDRMKYFLSLDMLYDALVRAHHFLIFLECTLRSNASKNLMHLPCMVVIENCVERPSSKTLLAFAHVELDFVFFLRQTSGSAIFGSFQSLLYTTPSSNYRTGSELVCEKHCQRHSY